MGFTKRTKLHKGWAAPRPLPHYPLGAFITAFHQIEDVAPPPRKSRILKLCRAQTPPPPTPPTSLVNPCINPHIYIIIYIGIYTPI